MSIRVKYNDQEVRKVKYNGKYVDQINYNGTNISFGSFNAVALQTFAEKPTISASISNAEAVVNLYNGNLKVMIPDVSFGNQSLGIGVAHIYNSMMDNDEIYNAKWTFMGYGFKINYQQYLIKVHTNLYYYIDGSGTKHEIVPAINGTTLYDTSGLGLIMTINVNEYLLTDRMNNVMKFDIRTGFITNITTNLGHVTVINYDNMMITEISKTVGTKTVRMYFSYDKLDRLSSISYQGSNKKIIYEYYDETNLLKSIKQKYGSKEELLAHLVYNEKRISQITNLSNQTLIFEYTGGKINKVKEGIKTSAKLELIRIQTMIYNKTLKNTEVRTRLVTDTTVATQSNQVRMVYNYNYNGDFLTAYEIIENNNIESFVSTVPTSKLGTRIIKKEENSEKPSFNGVQINVINQNSTRSDYQYQINSLSNNCGVMMEAISDTSDFQRTYTISCWYKFNIIPLHQISIKVYFEGAANIEKEILLKETKWNFLSFEKQFNKGTKPKSMKIYILTESQNFEINISDFRFIQNPTITKMGNYDIREIDKIISNMETIISDPREITSYYQTYITARDINQNQLEASKNNDIFYTNNLKKMHKLTPDFCFKSGENLFYWEINEHDSPFIYNNTIKDRDSSITSYVYYADNKIVEISKTSKKTRVEKKYNSKYQLIEEIDEYNIQKLYEYDAFGNIIKTTIEPYQNENNELRIIQESIYDEYGNLKQAKNSTGDFQTYHHDSIHGNLDTITEPTQTLKVEYLYDDFKDKIDTVNLYKDNNLSTPYTNCIFEYNELSQLTKIFRSDGQTYGFNYDKYGNISNYKLNNVSTKSINTSYKEDRIECETVYSYGIWWVNNYDIYGKLNYQTESRSEANIFTTSNNYINLLEDYNGRKTSASLVRNSTDKYSGVNYSFEYDENENLYQCTYSNNKVGRELFAGHIKAKNATVADAIDIEYHYETFNNEVSRISRVTYDSKKVINPRINRVEVLSSPASIYEYDELGRIKTLRHRHTMYTYYYKNVIVDDSIRSSTNIIEKVYSQSSDISTDYPKIEYIYTYDKKGNITNIKKEVIQEDKKVTEKANNLSYAYDSLNRLYKESNYSAGTTVFHLYDNFGNQTEKYQAAYNQTAQMPSDLAVSYVYDETFKDRLIKIKDHKNSNELFFSYSSAGNPIKYKVDSLLVDSNMYWERGNLLKQYNCNKKIIQFSYNYHGVRTKKSIDGVDTNFHLDGKKIMAVDMTIKGNVRRYQFHYDLNGLYGFTWNSHDYLYEKDALGNIIGIHMTEASNGSKVVTYDYDARGMCTEKIYADSEISDIVKYNPFRWKGYYFDIESGLYYITSIGRYYDPETGRFINDNLSGMAYNVSGYAVTNPFALSPSNFNCSPSLPLTPEFSADNSDEMPFWAKITIGTIINAGLWISVPFTGGATLPAAIGATVTAGISVATSGLSFQSGISYQWDWDKAADTYMWGSITGAISGYLGGYIGEPTSGFAQTWWQQGLWNAGANMGITAGQQLITTGTIDPLSVGISGIFGFAGGALGVTSLGQWGNGVASGIGLGTAEAIAGILYDDLVANQLTIELYLIYLQKSKNVRLAYC